MARYIVHVGGAPRLSSQSMPKETWLKAENQLLRSARAKMKRARIFDAQDRVVYFVDALDSHTRIEIVPTP